ncbi:uncharacterized protein BJX67DRAFT_118853 [Aspergillus lucknowensis]|uniref:Serine-threonine rich protein n=1 Tax=Aspergillus lucknowensis TaxID=176173 RepID=A0ABR4LQR0_9EURO
MAPIISLSSARRRTLPGIIYTTDSRALNPSLRCPNHLYQARSLWWSSHERYDHNPHKRRFRLVCGDWHHFRPSHYPPREKPGYYDYRSCRKPRWNVDSPKAGFRGHPSVESPGYAFWETQSARARQRIEWMKKEIDADPYAAIFGRRLDPFGSGFGFKLENGFTSLCRSLLGLDTPSPRTVDRTVDKPPRAHAKVHRRPRPVIPEEESEGLRPQYSSSSGDALFEFDPISGRMIPKESKLSKSAERDAERSPTDSSAADTASQFQQPDSSPPTKTVETTVTEVSDSSNTDSPAHQYSSTSTAESSSAYAAAHKDQDSASMPTPKAPDSISIPCEVQSEAIEAEGPGPDSQIKPSSPADSTGNSITPGDATPHTSQTPNSGEPAVSDRPVVERLASGQDLDRVGFLSRRDKPLSALTIDQEEAAIENRDNDLDRLRASDIRAAYEPRWLHIKSEVDAEKVSGKTSADNATFVASNDQQTELLESQNESTPIAAQESSTSAAPSLADEQAPSGTPSQHEAPEATSVPPFSVYPAAEVYRVFAYDPSARQVVEAETISSLHASSEYLHATEVLTRLTNPAKFLPCLNQMRTAGYEIVSGGGDILIFRKASKHGTRRAGRTHSHNMIDHNDRGRSTRDGLSEPGAALEQQATSFYTGNRYTDNWRPLLEKSTGKKPPKSRVGKILRRMLVGGAATAGTCYAIGVVTEFFRTGGQDGWGIDGFTEFESERRHRGR